MKEDVSEQASDATLEKMNSSIRGQSDLGHLPGLPQMESRGDDAGFQTAVMRKSDVNSSIYFTVRINLVTEATKFAPLLYVSLLPIVLEIQLSEISDLEMKGRVLEWVQG